MNRFVVSFAHTDYQYYTFGTEKFMRNLDILLAEEGINHLNFFGFNKIGEFSPYVGVNFNGNFEGIVNREKIECIINEYEIKLNLCKEKIYIQHLLNWNMKTVGKLIQKAKVPVVIFLHDYYFECVRFSLTDDKGNFCGEKKPSEEKCKNCKYWRKEKRHIQKVNAFINETDKYIENYIAPSEIVKKVFVNMFSDVGDKIIIRPHLITEGAKQYEPIKERLIVGYLGNQDEKKGYQEWKIITEQFASDYEFKYLGIGDKKILGVKNVFVSTAKQGNEAMINAIRQEKVSIAFMWSKSPETYSYVYFELLVNGVFIVTFKDSGNVAVLVKENGNGIVFDTLKECIDWLGNSDEVRKCVNEYRCGGGLKPERVRNNPSTKYLFETNNECNDVQGSRKMDGSNLIDYSHYYNLLLTGLYKKVLKK